MNLNRLQRMDPIAFERFVGELFKKMGYRVEDTRASADEGIDLVLRRGRGMAVVQCKRYSGSVGQPVVRDLYGVMLHTRSAEAYLVTTGTITQAAYRWAEGKPIHLVDGHRLVEWTRTGRLNYDQRPQLRRGRRAWLWLGIAALFLVGSILAGTPGGSAQLQSWQQSIQGVWSGPGDAAGEVAEEATATPTVAVPPLPPQEGAAEEPPQEPTPEPLLAPDLDSARPGSTPGSEPGSEPTRRPAAPPGEIPLPGPVDPES